MRNHFERPYDCFLSTMILPLVSSPVHVSSEAQRDTSVYRLLAKNVFHLRMRATKTDRRQRR